MINDCDETQIIVYVENEIKISTEKTTNNKIRMN